MSGTFRDLLAKMTVVVVHDSMRRFRSREEQEGSAFDAIDAYGDERITATELAASLGCACTLEEGRSDG